MIYNRMNLEVTSVEAKRKTSLKDHSAQAKYVRSVTLNEKLDCTREIIH
jgi:hypothetical protein